MNTEVKRPLVRYHGGKFVLAPWIISHFPAHRIYVEPYGGGASVLLRKSRSYAEIYNDLDDEIVNVFKVARDDGQELHRRLLLTPFSRNDFKAAYLPASDNIERARNTIIRSFMGFGSDGINSKHKTGFRSNSNRSGTTPSHDWKNYGDLFPNLIDRLRGVVVENRDALEVMAGHDSPQTLHYVDPPYVHSTRTGRGQYKHEMTDKEHEVLAGFLHSLQGAVVLSGYHSPLYDRLYSGWRMVEKDTHADGGLKRKEVLWISPKNAPKRGPLI